MEFCTWVASRFRGARIRADGEVELDCFSCGAERKLWVNTLRGRGICFRCGLRFGALKMVAAVDGVSMYEAAQLVMSTTADLPRLSEAVATRVAATAGVDVPESSAPVVADDSPLAQCARAYLASRGISDEDAAFYGLRYCWAGPYAYRIVFPYRDLDGAIVYWAARKIDSLNIGGPKMLYPKAPRSGLLFNIDVAQVYQRIILVEGPIDAVHVGHDAVALGGCDLAREQCRLLRQVGATEIVVLLDSDSAGAVGARKALRELLGYPWSVRLAALPAGRKDPGECSRDELRTSIDAAEPMSSLSLLRASLFGGTLATEDQA